MIRKGQIYSHYKRPNKRYEILELGLNSETMEEMIVYKALYQGEFPFGQIWIRPKKMFEETIEKNGEKIARFKLIEE
jgi:cyclomaltodextrinase / maltogenic alpha-amylase / neopullulanase